MERKIKSQFPEYFSAEALQKILLYGRAEEINVYRVGKYGHNDNKAFLNYYDEVLLGLKPIRKKEAALKKYRHSIGNLSISCYEDFDDIKDYYMLTLKDDYPKRILLRGKTSGECGLSCRTRSRDENCSNSHVDWWLYQDASPWQFFHEVEVM